MTAEKETENSELSCGMVAVVGRANVGKSTLVNHALQEKISIVTPIAQTTRNAIRGILTEPHGQLVFIDTPGIHKAPGDLGKIMNRLARASVEGVDVILLVFDATTSPRLEDEGWIRRILREEAQCYVVLNKIDQDTDLADRYRKRWAEIEEEKDIRKPAQWFRASALTGEGMGELLAALFRAVPKGPLLFPEDVLTDFPRKLAVADFIREKLIRDLRDELPHSVAVSVDDIDEEDNQWNIGATIYVQKPSQKGIVIGHKGRRLRSIRRASEQELSKLYELETTVTLRVKVVKDWARNFWMLKKLGYHT